MNDVFEVKVAESDENLGKEENSVIITIRNKTEEIVNKNPKLYHYFKYLYGIEFIVILPFLRCTEPVRCTCVTRNLVMRSGSLPFSLDSIISNMSPWSFSMTTKTRSGVSNMHSRLTMPGWWRFCRRQI